MKLNLILPSLAAGGMEKVMILLAENFIKRKDVTVTLTLLTKNKIFYSISPEVTIIEPPFDYREYSRVHYTIKTFRFLRATLKRENPDTVLSFGGKYNAFVVLASLGLRIPVYVSDRSRPSISYGKLQDIMNPRVYRLAAGIIAQTERAKVFFERTTRHPNIGIIGNPIRAIHTTSHQHKNVILNVGRFIATKHQDWLVDYFAAINNPAWRLVFLGDGELLERVQQKALQCSAADRIEFLGNQKDIDRYYAEAKIFAFTSTSEGFPNALGEAMAAGLACISFDCEAGPSDLITSGDNGILVGVGDHSSYKKALAQLMENDQHREQMGKRALQSMTRFEAHTIAEKFYHFITDHAHPH